MTQPFAEANRVSPLAGGGGEEAVGAEPRDPQVSFALERVDAVMNNLLFPIKGGGHPAGR